MCRNCQSPKLEDVSEQFKRFCLILIYFISKICVLLGCKKNNTCPICFLELSRSEHVKRHIEGVHSDIRPYKCLYCDKSYKQNCHLKRHVNHKHEDPTFECEICDKKFGDKYCLERHLKIHGNRERPTKKNCLEKNQ